MPGAVEPLADGVGPGTDREHLGRLAHRRFELLPLRGPGAVFTETQGRMPGDSTTPAELADLISSIATVGVLQPILVEEIPQPDAPPARRLVTGERRLRAARWGAAHHDSPHFDAIPAVCCPGPLSEEERRRWQLLENLAREDLQPGELAAALLLERCALATVRLLAAGRPVPAEVHQIDDPVRRWAALERIRGTDTGLGAPWPDVLGRLGLQLSSRKARELVRAFAALPRELSEEMDEAKIRLHTRIRFARLRTGRAAAADEIWSAVRSSTPGLLGSAVQHCLDRVDLAGDDAVELARDDRDHANEARRRALLRGDEPPPATGQGDENDAARLVNPGPVEAGLVEDARRALGVVLSRIRGGERLHRYDLGSLQLLLDELRDVLAAAAGPGR